MFRMTLKNHKFEVSFQHEFPKQYFFSFPFPFNHLAELYLIAFKICSRANNDLSAITHCQGFKKHTHAF